MMKRRLLRALITAGVFSIAMAGCGHETPIRPFEPDCSTPRAAVQTWLDNELAGEKSAAITCFDWSGAGVSGDARERLSFRFLRILDTRGHRVRHTDLLEAEPEGGWPREVQLFADQDTSPEFFLVRNADRWVFSAESVRDIDRVYDELLPVDLQQYVPDVLRDQPLLGVAWWQFLGLLLLILLGMMARLVTTFSIASSASRVLRRRGEGTSHELLLKAAQPIGTLVLGLVIWRLLPLLQFSVGFNNVAIVAIRVIVALSGVMLVYRLVDVASDILAGRAANTDTKLDDQLIPLMRKSAKVIVVVIGGIFVLQNLDVDVASLLAGVGVGGLAFSFAARDMVANLFGSVSIFADGPFQIGDWVDVGGNEGAVEEVGMRATRIRTASNTVLTIPNSKIADSIVENWSQRPRRRAKLTLGIGYDSTPEQIEAFCRGIGEVLRANSFVQEDTHGAMMSGFGDSALEVTVYFQLEVPGLVEELQQKHIIYIEFLRLAAALGVEFAYPTQTVHVASVAPTAPVATASVGTAEALAAIADSFGPDGERASPNGVALPARAGEADEDESE